MAFYEFKERIFFYMRPQIECRIQENNNDDDGDVDVKDTMHISVLTHDFLM